MRDPTYLKDETSSKIFSPIAMAFITIPLLPQAYMYLVFSIVIINPAEDDVACICSRTSFKAFVLRVRMAVLSAYASICHVLLCHLGSHVSQ
jgi:hypothetical protein